MADEIHYTTIEEQIEKLKSQNLIFTNEELAKTFLELYGYSSLIKSYRDPYVITTGSKKVYRSGVTFEQVFSLYIFDKNLRNAVMSSMQDLEEYIKEAAANVVGESFGVHQDQYLLFRNYQNKRKRKARFCLPGILDTMRSTLNTDKEPIHHYMTVHQMVPPWILFKSIYFSTTVNFIDLFKREQQEKMVAHLYDPSSLDLSVDSLCKLMMDTLFICIDYRNMAAHGGRIYNYNSSSRLRTDEIFGSDNDINVTGFSKLLFLLSLFDYKHPYKHLSMVLQNEISRHCSLYPEDITYLGQILNINIKTKEAVWISDSSNKFHATSHCSGIQNARRIDFSEAKENGYIPCKRCFK